jgi:hypothetical protein
LKRIFNSYEPVGECSWTKAIEVAAITDLNEEVETREMLERLDFKCPVAITYSAFTAVFGDEAMFEMLKTLRSKVETTCFPKTAHFEAIDYYHGGQKNRMKAVWVENDHAKPALVVMDHDEF